MVKNGKDQLREIWTGKTHTPPQRENTHTSSAGEHTQLLTGSTESREPPHGEQRTSSRGAENLLTGSTEMDLPGFEPLTFRLWGCSAAPCTTTTAGRGPLGPLGGTGGYWEVLGGTGGHWGALVSTLNPGWSVFFSQIRVKSISSRKYKKQKNVSTGPGGAAGRERTRSVLNAETTVQIHPGPLLHVPLPHPQMFPGLPL